jgi:hypothetical protein
MLAGSRLSWTRHPSALRSGRWHPSALRPGPGRRAWAPGGAVLAVAAGVALAAVAAAPVAVAGQADPATDTNVLFPIEYIEQRLQAPELDIVELDRSRPLEADRARRVVLAGRDGESPMQVHWKPVAPPGYGFNNEPRYELAAYRFQKMFLAEEEYVVPPTALRAMPIDEYQDVQAFRHPTIRGTRSVLFLLSYWIQNLSVDTVDPYRPEMFELNRSYHRHFANANLLTHLIDHKDGNHGNLLVSRDGLNMRVFAVDNDVAFRSDVSDRGDRWRRLLVDELPAATVERLRGITREQLDAELGVLAEFQIVDEQLVPVEPGPNASPRRGVRTGDDRVQFGLTQGEINDLERRIRNVLRDVDRGRIRVF